MHALHARFITAAQVELADIGQQLRKQTSFVAIGAHQYRHLHMPAAGDCSGRWQRQRLATGHRRPRIAAGQSAALWCCIGQRVGRQCAQACGRIGRVRAAQALCHTHAATFCLALRHAGIARQAAAALQDGALKQPRRAGRSELITDAPRTGRFAEHGDVVRIAAERGDIALHPAQGRLLVEQCIGAFAFATQAWMRVETEYAQPIVGRHHNHILARSQRAQVVVDIAAQFQRAVIDPHHHRAWMRRCGAGRCVDIQREAIFGHVLLPDAIARQTSRAGLGGIADLRPRGWRLRCAKAQFTHGRRCERHPQECPTLCTGHTAHRAGRCLHHLGTRIRRVHQRRHLAGTARCAANQQAGCHQKSTKGVQFTHAPGSAVG